MAPHSYQNMLGSKYRRPARRLLWGASGVNLSFISAGQYGITIPVHSQVCLRQDDGVGSPHHPARGGRARHGAICSNMDHMVHMHQHGPICGQYKSTFVNLIEHQ